MKLIITDDTFLKALPYQAGVIQQKGLPNQLFGVKAGQTFELDDNHPYEGNKNSLNDDHVFIQLAEPLNGQPGIRWFVYGHHAHIEGTDPGNDPKDEPAEQQTEAIAKAKADKDYGPKISIPGISRPVGIYEPIYFEPSVSNFTWSELTKGGARIPVDATATVRIVQLAKYLDKVREFLGSKPIRITSGYRDPATNRRVGGARSSRHMAGDAVDFYLPGTNVVDIFNQLKPYHKTGGLAVGNGFVHLDMRPGAPARWTYPRGPRVSLW